MAVLRGVWLLKLNPFEGVRRGTMKVVHNITILTCKNTQTEVVMVVGTRQPCLVNMSLNLANP